MNKIIIYCILLTITMLVGCNSSSDEQQLLSAYKMMDNDSVDEAEMIVTLYADTEMNDKSRAIYNLCKTRLNYFNDNEVYSDSLINYSILYYKKQDDKYLLAESYFYKGVTQAPNKSKDAIVCLKEAEIYSKDIDIPVQANKIYTNLCYLYFNGGEYTLAKEYARKALNLAKKEKNYKWYLVAANYLASCYYNTGEIDSVAYYFESLKPYINSIDNIKKGEILAAIGTMMAKIGMDNNLAERYLQESIDITPNSAAFGGLALLATNNNDHESALELLEKAYQYSIDAKDSILNAQVLLQQKINVGDYKGACLLYSDIAYLKDCIAEVTEGHNLAKIQNQYNVIAKEREFQAKNQRNILIIVIVIVIVLLWFFHNHIKMMKLKHKQLQDQLLIQSYDGKIKDLEDSESASVSQVKDLKEKVSQLQQHQNERLTVGKKLYEDVVNGGSIVAWSKQDYVNFFEYYKLVNISFMKHVESDYDNLSPRSILYLILADMDKTEEEMEKIFGIGNSAVRSIKSRTKSRMIKSKNED